MRSCCLKRLPGCECSNAARYFESFICYAGYSLRVLEKEGLILPSREGAILTPEFLESKDKIIAEAQALAEEMQEIFHNLKTSLLKK